MVAVLAFSHRMTARLLPASENIRWQMVTNCYHASSITPVVVSFARFLDVKKSSSSSNRKIPSVAVARDFRRPASIATVEHDRSLFTVCRLQPTVAGGPTSSGDRCMGGNCFSFQREMAAPVVLQAGGRQTAAVIFLHGLGDTGHGWSQAFMPIRAPHVKYIFPHAPIISVTLNHGMEMPSWFDIKGLSANSPEDEVGIRQAAKAVHSLIDDEVKSGTPSNRIVLGGFSQGGALALFSAFTYQKPLAGVVGLSCWLPLRKDITPEVMAVNRSVPILQCHGKRDFIVHPDLGRGTAELLQSLGCKHTMKWFEHLDHASSEEEMRRVGRFIDSHLPAADA